MANGSAVVDEIWELIKETRIDMRKFDERMEEFRAGMKDLRATQKETAKQLKETAKQLKETDRRFNTQWGRLVESLVEGSLVSLLKLRGIEVRHTAPNLKVSFTEDDGGLKHKEFDIVVLNGTEAVAVEVKTTLTPDKVSYFLSAMEDFKRYFPDYRHKSVYGAVAYLRSEAEAERYAERQGLFVIRATGDSASIVNKEHFKPKEFPSKGGRLSHNQ
ncbi:MAG: hypothetical protein F4239_01640 [Gammaproteobacteria bacterium]|nr:hypothetical protein [Gammaproteobacteria bacterium]MYD77649.1 hypothetical protein [Gammaproteobacteria bacterium]MYI90128.1 hypothetical protein [Gammaproteobacteria bacterium]